jgi:uncharacterized RDD family membrane protein YckC
MPAIDPRTGLTAFRNTIQGAFMQQDNPHADAAVSGHLVTCVECGNRFPEGEVIQFGQYSVCANCKPLFQQKLAEGSFRPSQLKFATVRRRFAAVLLDSMVLWFVMFIVMMGIFAAIGKGVADPSAMGRGTAVWYLFSFGISAAYMIFFMGKFGATPGKMALGIKVVRPDGAALGYPLAVGRYFSTFVSSLTLCIGYVIAIFDKEKRALHDRIAGTRVIRT